MFMAMQRAKNTQENLEEDTKKALRVKEKNDRLKYNKIRNLKLMIPLRLWKKQDTNVCV